MCTVLNGERVKLLIKSGTGSYFSGKVEKLRAFVEEGPGAKLSLAYMHGKSNSSAVILPQWAKKKRDQPQHAIYGDLRKSGKC